MTVRAAVAVVLALLAAGCAGDVEPAGGDDAPQLSAVSVYGRHAAVRGKVDVRIANAGPGPVEIEAYRVEHPLFEPVAPFARRSRLPGDGKARIVPVPFGAPRCDAEQDREARVVVTMRTEGVAREVAVPLADGEPGLARAHRLACAVEAVAQTAQLELGPWTLGPGLVARTTLRLQRRGPGEVAVLAVGGSILFSVDSPGGDPLLSLPAGADTASVELAVRATRCESHALTESKTSFTFPVSVSVGGAEPSAVPVTVAAADRAVLQTVLERTCAPG